MDVVARCVDVVERCVDVVARYVDIVARCVFVVVRCVRCSPVCLLLQLSLYIQSHLELLDEAGKVPRLLDLLCERMMKQKDTNHVLAIKFHFIGCVVRQCVKSRRQHGDNLQAWIRR